MAELAWGVWYGGHKGAGTFHVRGRTLPGSGSVSCMRACRAAGGRGAARNAQLPVNAHAFVCCVWLSIRSDQIRLVGWWLPVCALGVRCRCCRGLLLGRRFASARAATVVKVRADELAQLRLVSLGLVRAVSLSFGRWSDGAARVRAEPDAAALLEIAPSGPPKSQAEGREG